LKADRKAYQDQKQVQKLGNQRGDGSTGNAHSGGTQLSEDEQIVQSGVRRYRAKTCPKGDSGVFLAAQPCGQDGADRHGQIRERHDAEVPRPHTADGSPCPERRILMNGGQSGNAFPACQCICNTQSPDALFAPPPCLRYIRQSIFAKQPETHYAGNDKAAVQKAEKENRNSAFTPAPAATYVCYTLLGKRR
jgi:hypothetical protein